MDEPMITGSAVEIDSEGVVHFVGWLRDKDGRRQVGVRFAMPLTSAIGFYKMLGCEILRTGIERQRLMA